ncbi:MAG: sulfatase-like hydrolase/transferase [Bacteroidota bacterium]
MKFRPYLILLSLLAFLFSGCQKEPSELPNILWITSEDNSPLLGCYGDAFATTPNMDQMAKEGFRYTNAYANTPVCAPARNTIITGVHACSNGNEQMRSSYLKSESVRFYTEFLKSKGYYCTNNSKTDYNTSPIDLETMWDECGNQAHYKNRAENQPFFAIFNFTTSHESCIHKSIPSEELRHRSEEVVLPPYHPDTPEMRHDWAQYYDKVEDMDAEVGEVLQQLEEAGLSENTIVFYYSDHGGVIGRSKRYLFETGTHVPMIIRIPEKYKHLYPAAKPGSEVERLVSFVDLAPTLLSMIGMEAPDYMQGHAFLGKYQKEEPAYIYMFRDRMDGRYDMSRSIVDRQYRYTRNFNSNRIYMQHLEYLWRAPSMVSWENAFLTGQCNEVQSRFWNTKPVEELYDTENDPWEVNNLAGDPEYSERLAAMRTASQKLGADLMDAGYIPEADRSIRSAELPIYDYMRSDAVPHEKIMEAAWLATEANPENLDKLKELLSDDDSAIRYWAVQGMLLLGEDARPALADLEKAAFDESWNVSVVAAEALYRLGQKGQAVKAINRVLDCDYPMARTFALNSIDHMNGSAEEFLDRCLGVFARYEELAWQYDVRVSKRLLEKWEVDAAFYGVNFAW